MMDPDQPPPPLPAEPSSEPPPLPSPSLPEIAPPELHPAPILAPPPMPPPSLPTLALDSNGSAGSGVGDGDSRQELSGFDRKQSVYTGFGGELVGLTVEDDTAADDDDDYAVNGSNDYAGAGDGPSAAAQQSLLEQEQEMLDEVEEFGTVRRILSLLYFSFKKG